MPRSWRRPTPGPVAAGRVTPVCAPFGCSPASDEERPSSPLFPLLMSDRPTQLGLNQLAFEQQYCQGHCVQIGERRSGGSGAETARELPGC